MSIKVLSIGSLQALSFPCQVSFLFTMSRHLALPLQVMRCQPPYCGGSGVQGTRVYPCGISVEKQYLEPQLTAFAFSIIKQGFDLNGMDSFRSNFKPLRLETYHVLSPPLIDALSIFIAKPARVLGGYARGKLRLWGK